MVYTLQQQQRQVLEECSGWPGEEGRTAPAERRRTGEGRVTDRGASRRRRREERDFSVVGRTLSAGREEFLGPGRSGGYLAERDWGCSSLFLLDRERIGGLCEVARGFADRVAVATRAVARGCEDLYGAEVEWEGT